MDAPLTTFLDALVRVCSQDWGVPMSEVPGWRGLSDDAQRVTFWVGAGLAIMTAIVVGTIYGAWAWYWNVPPELKIGQGAGIVTGTIVLIYALLIASHTQSVVSGFSRTTGTP